MEEIELVVLTKGHDIQDTDSQWTNILTLSVLRCNPRNTLLPNERKGMI
jgi:hypothetical protein